MKKPRNIGQKVSTGILIFASGALIAAAALAPAAQLQNPQSEATQAGLGERYIEQLVSAQPVSMSCPPAFTVAGYDDISDDDFAGESASQYTLTASSLPRTAASTGGPSSLASTGTLRAALQGTGETAGGGLATITGAGSSRLTLEGEQVAEGSQLTFPPSVAGTTNGDAESMALAGAVAAQKTPAGDGRSLVSTMCQVPEVTQWLVGPDTLVGSSANLVLSNPGLTSVTVSLRIWGSAGQLDHEETYTIPPDHVRTVLLEARTLESRLAVEVTSAGGPVAAMLYHHVLNGLTASGVDSLTATASPARSAWIPPFRMPATEEQYGEVVLVNPNDELTHATVSVVGPSGVEELAGAQEIPIDPHTVVAVPLGGTNENWAGLLVESDDPVAASAQFVWRGQPNPIDPSTQVSDRTWIPAADPTDQQVFVVPEVPQLHVTASLLNTTDTAQIATVRTIGADGTETELDVNLRPQSSHTFEHEMLTPGATVMISGQGIIASAWLQLSDDLGPMFSVMMPLPDQQRSQTIPVAVETP